MYTHKHQTLSHRIVKQTLQASGSNVTPEHIEEVSLSSLFLLEAAKKMDREFGVTPMSQMHTVREANSDKRKVALHNTKVCSPCRQRMGEVKQFRLAVWSTLTYSYRRR